MLAERGERRGEVLEPLVFLQPSDAQQHHVVSPDSRGQTDVGRIGRGCEAVEPSQIDGVRDNPDPIGAHLKVFADNGLQDSIGSDDAVGRFRAREDCPAERQIAGTLEPRRARTRRAKFFEALWIQDERRRFLRAPSGVAKDTRAEAVDDVDLAVVNEL